MVWERLMAPSGFHSGRAETVGRERFQVVDELVGVSASR
jgi:hypothetical protein